MGQRESEGQHSSESEVGKWRGFSEWIYFHRVFIKVLRELVVEVSADSGLQLDLEIALSVVSPKVQLHTNPLLPGRRCVETSGDVIDLYY